MPRPPFGRAKPPSSLTQVRPPGPACAHLARSAWELRIVSSSTYGFQSPPSTRISVALTPEVASVASRSTATSPAYCALGASPLSFAVVAGPVLSSLTVTVRVDSTLPFLSTERYSIVREPSAVTLNGALYAVQFAAPASRYSV